MALSQPGLWNLGGFNLPDFGLTERFGGGPTNQNVSTGGAAFSGPMQPTYGPAQPQYQRPAAPAGAAYGPFQSGVLGTGVGGGGRLSQPGGGGGQADPFSAAQRAAQDQYNAQLGQENSQFDYMREQLQNQLGGLGGQRDTALGEIENSLGNVRNEVGKSRSKSQANTETQIQEAGSTARSTQQQNRNVLRALGIINSSAAGELLSKPINEFDKQRGQLNQALGQRFTELDDFLNTKVSEAETVKNGIRQKYDNLVSQIQTDMRFNERQRLDAVRSANSALSQRLADIQGTLLDYQNQVNLQKQQFAQGIQQVGSYEDPRYQQQAFAQLGLSTPQAQQQQIGISPIAPEQKKKTGLLSALGF